MRGFGGGLVGRGADDAAERSRDAELEWWLKEWEPVVRGGGLNPGDVQAILGGEPVADTYEARRWQVARATVLRVADEAGYPGPEYFEGKVVVDIGPGPLGFPDACPARLSIGVEPLAEDYARSGLLLDSPALYLASGAERIPLVSASVDIVIARNSLDHVEDPAAVVQEATRLLRPGGELVLNVDLENQPNPAEPHSFTLEDVRGLLAHLTIEREDVIPEGHGGGDPGPTGAVLVVARKPAA
ncbi:MAG: hypothetical protein QOJ07_2301 [Thermoleophilaceae bacterium]|nr:hypothetical protein [Thermoleophilaceae bacterium]